jgi:hypothetical protein
MLAGSHVGPIHFQMIWSLQCRSTILVDYSLWATKLVEYACLKPTLQYVGCQRNMYLLSGTLGSYARGAMLIDQATPHDYMDFKFYTEFQSHGLEFDCLKSLEIEERISVLRWLKKPANFGHYLLSTNGRWLPQLIAIGCSTEN